MKYVCSEQTANEQFETSLRGHVAQRIHVQHQFTQAKDSGLDDVTSRNKAKHFNQIRPRTSIGTDQAAFCILK